MGGRRLKGEATTSSGDDLVSSTSCWFCRHGICKNYIYVGLHQTLKENLGGQAMYEGAGMSVGSL